ncbi:3-keto-disaccharide hydrolase [Robiginitalea marina]|uniref:DUF1080 domain-containing protein n=1 Tax=Robiginitalea marina TaxID=2954105 RepID=A0ABT1AWU5_9FLAO|nr:DUF1080 domain-containing protein [Robiginitalea marina]MCO5724361.1 DUF1080 domain-containing protein [Robiginitalea marina]
MKRKQLIGVIALLAMTACKERPSGNTLQTAELSMEEAGSQQEWIVLFDGTSLDAWRGYGREDLPPSWKIEDGALVFYPPEKPLVDNHNLVTKQDFRNFVLSLEWKISEGGNSGIFWGVQEDPWYREPYQTGPEIQVLDNERHPDAKNGTTHQAGALYDMVAPARDVTRPAGEWNHCEITVDYGNNRGSVRLNGSEIVTFPLANEAWEAMVANSKFNGWKGFGEFHTGKIGLQDHGDPVAFRNIKIKPL